MKWTHTAEMEVRDYELDSQGIVNNAIYQNYLEHARHLMLKQLGLDFGAMHEESWDPVVVHIEMDFRFSLRSGMQFQVKSGVELVGKLRYVFTQEIITNQTTLVLVARTTVTTLYKGRPKYFAKMFETFEKISGLAQS